jgi:hypothetical protein
LIGDSIFVRDRPSELSTACPLIVVLVPVVIIIAIIMIVTVPVVDGCA